MALVPIIEGAGGLITDWEGGPRRPCERPCEASGTGRAPAWAVYSIYFLYDVPRVWFSIGNPRGHRRSSSRSSVHSRLPLSEGPRAQKPHGPRNREGERSV